MARLTSEITFTGSLGNLSAYKMRGSDKIIIRKKGGASKEKIRRAPQFDLTRRYGAEFGGRSRMASNIIHKLGPLKMTNDYSLMGPLNKLLKAAQVMDTDSALGKRHVLLSKNPTVVEGFPMNRRITMESVIRSPIAYTLSREKMEATIELPALNTDTNFIPDLRYAAFRWVMIAMAIPDFYFDPLTGYRPRPDAFEAEQSKITDWYMVRSGAPATTVSISLGNKPEEDDFTLLLAVGIVYGHYVDSQKIAEVKHVGCGKILVGR
jgi:hypothetical protein